MPELYFQVRWPDGETQRCYSPSTVIEAHLTPGGVYDLADFLDRSRTALDIASERVREKYGFACTGASDQLARLEERVSACTSLAEAKETKEGKEGKEAKVTVECFLNADGSVR